MSLPELPSNFQGDFISVAEFSAPVKRPVEPVGKYFLAHATRTLRGHTWSEYEKIEAENNVKVADNEDDEDEFDTNQDAELLSHDPRDWKTADLYAVLGLQKYRYKATEDQIIRAHRKQVLVHHPDKLSAKGGLNQDGFFKIIQKAYELMLDSNKRRQYDSCDFNADVPPPPKPKGKKGSELPYDFFEAWGPVFESEARFSNKQPVPTLGDANSTKKEVDAFYKFWQNFDSWRTFEYLDEDVPDDTSNRDHKRYIEKKNNNARKKKKTEDNKRLSELVQRASSEDVRIKFFKDAEKAEKAAKKKQKTSGSDKAVEDAKLKKEAEEKAKKEAEEQAKASKESSKKAKEAAKNAKKKNKRAIRNAAKDNAYFGSEDKSTQIDADIDALIEAFDDVKLGEVASKLNGADAATVQAVLHEAAKELSAAGKVSSLKFLGA